MMRTMYDLLLGTFSNALKNIEELVPPLQNTLRQLFTVMMLSSLRPRSHGTGSVWSPYQFEKSQDEHDS